MMSLRLAFNAQSKSFKLLRTAMIAFIVMIWLVVIGIVLGYEGAVAEAKLLYKLHNSCAQFGLGGSLGLSSPEQPPCVNFYGTMIYPTSTPIY
jgi:hypothetical protein